MASDDEVGGGELVDAQVHAERPSVEAAGPGSEVDAARLLRQGHVLGDEIAELAAHLDAALHRLLGALRMFEDSGAWAAQGFQSCASWLSWRVGWSIGVAREKLRVARRLPELPLVDDALRRGELSYCKARAITRVATPAIEAALVEDARYTTGAQLETLCRKYASVQRADTSDAEADDLDDRFVRRRVRRNGMIMIEASLHAEEAEVVWEALTQVARARKRPAAASGDPAIADEHRAPGDQGAEHAAAPVADSNSDPDTATGAAPVASAVADAGSAAAAAEPRGSIFDLLPLEDDAPPPAGPTVWAEEDDDPIPPGGVTISLVTGRIVSAGRGGGRVGAEPVPRDATEFDRASALVEVAQGILRGTRPERSPTEVVVTIPVALLTSTEAGVVPAALIGDRTGISAETARRLACDCGVVPLVEDDHGNSVALGRRRRTPDASLKRALSRRDATCRFPGCTNAIYLEAHHLVHWAFGGETTLENLVLTCSHHHRHLHEYGWTARMVDGEPRFFTPEGDLVPPHPPRPRLAGDPWHVLASANGALSINADTPACGWDGRPPRWDHIIDGLVDLDLAGARARRAGALVGASAPDASSTGAGTRRPGPAK